MHRRAWLHGATAFAATTAIGGVVPAAAEAVAAAPYGGIDRADPRYEIERQATVWQARKPVRRPDLIVAARSTADVVDAIRYAEARRMPVAIRGSGHNYCSTYLRDGGMLLDLAQLRGFERDGDYVRIGPGLRAQELIEALDPHGQAFPIAHVGTVGLGGFLLGGGMGWNGEDWGQFACFNVDGLEAVTARGDVLALGADSHPDLYWAARGAGPAFCAAATRFRLRVQPRPEVILANAYAFPLDAVPIVTRWLIELAGGGLSHVELTLVLETADGEHAGKTRPQCFVSATAFGPRAADARARLDRVARSAPRADALLREEFRALGFADLFAASNTGFPRRVTADNLWTDRPLDTVTALVEHFRSVPSRHTVVIANFRRRVALPADAAFSVQGSAYVMWLCAWDDSAEDAANQDWNDRAVTLTAPYAVGRYINETDVLRFPHHARQSYSAPAWERLKRVRARHDPDQRLPAPFLL
jgi:FAD/FMN-containing dehydrogenase